MILVGAIAVLANIRPVDYLQAIVVFSGTGAAATFCVPLLMLVFWRRATVPGMFASMLCGAGAMLTFYLVGGVLGYGSPLDRRKPRRFGPIFSWGSTRSSGAWECRFWPASA